ncbi:hypothetical protein BU23DRAFT_491236 [Bimuria novae-zelandiae CBS 107.79]|uniref:RING-type domain-containing protein n=1 Tax=Bimuria novae-zelandiae CBS 107.79 TaxID=1447943 RepID=A0A6A5UJ59_9PLEO|nr:hypothetical protein BU23DRAFT_491236 [Bimuria novae-zelandiae CBS 107.79]
MDVDVDLAQGELITAAACLQMVVEVLPDISVDHVLQLIADQTQDDTRTPEACQRIITQLLDGGEYPKEVEEEVSRKRKREHERSLSEFEGDDGEDRTSEYRNDAIDLLKDEFLYVPVRHIERVIREQKTFFKTYCAIEEQLQNYSRHRSFAQITKARAKRGIELKLVRRGSQIPKELDTAKKKCETVAIKRRKAEDANKEEENNLRKAVLAGEMQTCQCCFDDFPLNRMLGCGGDNIHFFCKACVKNYIESEMGSSRCRPVCFADTSCGGTFTRSQLQDCLGETSFDRLEHMQQMQDLEIAGLDLDECPFCDFKQECPPVEEDKEFRCLNPKCRKTSCRICQKETHIPLSCEEAKKDEKLTVRHIVEEAMTAALIRNCNKCKHPFIKEYGCNKMTCSHCRNQQCYICSEDIKDYKHFGEYDANREGCPLHDNIEDRHEQEVKKAADKAMAKVKAENPGVSDADLMIEVSDRVKRAEQRRLGVAQAAHHNFGFHMAGGALRNGPPPAAVAALAVPAIPAHGVPPGAPAQQQYVPAALQQRPLPAFVPQHVFIHQPQLFQQQFNFAFQNQQAYPAPVPLQPPPAHYAPGQLPQTRMVQWQGQQAPPQPQQAPPPQEQYVARRFFGQPNVRFLPENPPNHDL